MNAARQTGSIFGVAVVDGFSSLDNFRHGFKLAVAGAAAAFLIAATLALATTRSPITTIRQRKDLMS